ncbi:MAG TPA: response regulator, partial [Lachnospiraceae bacterium]|nr:response regulator [Lachnospiraceae bacterium]
MRILIVEDDKELCSILEYQMSKNNFLVDFCHNGDDADFYLTTNAYDVIVLDRMLPGKDGLSILNMLRSQKNATPVIMLTAMNTLENRIEGLDSGADDYLTKPFEVKELFARIRALARRSVKLDSSELLTFGDFSLDTIELILKTDHGSC